jgi:hypothetical protein
MNEHLPENSDPQMELALQAKGADDAQLLITIASLGMCQALATGTLSPDYACQRLFGPALLTRLNQMNACQELRHAIHMATELEDVANLIPDKLTSAISDVEDELLKVLTTLSTKRPAGEKWLVRINNPPPITKDVLVSTVKSILKDHKIAQTKQVVIALHKDKSHGVDIQGPEFDYQALWNADLAEARHQHRLQKFKRGKSSRSPVGWTLIDLDPQTRQELENDGWRELPWDGNNWVWK